MSIRASNCQRGHIRTMAGSDVATSLKRGRSSSEIIQQFNSVNAKILAALLVVTLLCYHGVLKITDTSDSCQWLLTKGRFQGDQVWQPYGCMLHTYSQLDANKCLRGNDHVKKQNYFVFIGDSRIRQLFHTFVKHFDTNAEQNIKLGSNTTGSTQPLDPEDDRPISKAHADQFYHNTDLDLSVDFFWNPFTNPSLVDTIEKLSVRKILPQLIVAGTGTWEIKWTGGKQEGLTAYGNNLISLTRVINNWPDNGTRILWKLQDPVEQEKLETQRQMITNDLIDSYNEVALEALSRSRVQIWFSARQVAESLSLIEEDGLHLGALPLKHQLQLLLNLNCNGRMNFHDGTCCRKTEAATTLQLVTFTILLLCFVVTVTWLAVQSFRMRRKTRILMDMDSQMRGGIEETCSTSEDGKVREHCKRNESAFSVNNNHSPVKKSEKPDWQVLMTSLGKLGLIMVYFYLCDRTSCFMKENKYYTTLNFWLPVGYIFALGLFFNEKSRSTKILHRDQTDEWKGWMQLVILIYHMTGASQIIPLYMHIRVLVSSYLFLTGYGHFCYFWGGGSASFVRFCQVLFRMNLMTVVICLCMNRPYQSYYFVPLVTFWYAVVYLTLVLPPQVTGALCDSKPAAYCYIIVKFICLFSCITVLYMSEVFFESVFLTRPWKALFVTPDEQVHEWWFRWSLDRYSICFGMVFGFLYVNAQKFGIVDDSGSGNLWSRCPTILVTLFSLAGIGSYTAFTFACHRKPDCNEIHPYIAFVPIVSFIMLRNTLGALRTRYSSFFAWFGRISLELFIGQYHIWLAADTHGVLVLVPNYPVLNIIVTSYILVCVAHEIHLITGQLVTLAVPSDWKRTLRNFVLFFIALVPIAIHDGMF